MLLEHRLSALLQLHLHSRLNHMASTNWVKKTARRVEKHLRFGSFIYYRIDGMIYKYMVSDLVVCEIAEL